VHPELLLPIAAEHDLLIVGSTMVGEYVVAGAPLLWVWRTAADADPPDTDW
jgi:uncharacterized membrane protein